MRIPAALAFSLVAFALATGTVFAGKVYHWKDEQGRSHFSDRPPPEAREVEERRVFTGTPDPALPFAVRQAAENFPVTIYVSDECGDPCERARALLNERRIPFKEHNLVTEEDVEAYREVFDGSVTVPAATVGTRQLRGFEAGAWNALLDSAGYPREPLPVR